MDCLFSIIDSKLTWSFVVFQEEYALMVLHAKIDNKWKYFRNIVHGPQVDERKECHNIFILFSIQIVFL